ncbi:MULTISPECIES: peroxiredoxin [Mameliella]|uniref:Glutathione-dependent peroxiredoxin n=1 Tax=Mameliella alba TaxID=561184 RepID=A0A0B3S174_9RHOB|nr:MULTISPECIES: peroxiredoxin [Mameliella]MBV6637369.1 peroxiredoxin [Mameliella sp.]MCR9273969.1 peroxiredoxin [Paracoccaceae bacterium]ODM50258.1 thiol peroxidase [Ruegeria sp. PBVC088]KHQ52713.1 Antioxidant, AhpC/Tsa family [Mameliella alba]MBY6117935.1 peroxiredoxin [Mameliella alba]
MAISAGDSLPEATLSRMGDEGPEQVKLSDLTKGRKVAIVGFPGAFSGTCDQAHLPSIIRVKDQLAAKGVEEIIGVAVNDVFVMAAWAKSSGAEEAGITMLGDLDASFAKSIGMDFSVPEIGFYDRLKRLTMLVEDGKVTVLNVEDTRGCTNSSGEALVEAI